MIFLITQLEENLIHEHEKLYPHKRLPQEQSNAREKAHRGILHWTNLVQVILLSLQCCKLIRSSEREVQRSQHSLREQKNLDRSSIICPVEELNCVHGENI